MSALPLVRIVLKSLVSVTARPHDDHRAALFVAADR